MLNEVQLGVQLHSETKVDEMCEVLDELQKYIPTKDCVNTYYILEGEQQCIEIKDYFKQYQILT